MKISKQCLRVGRPIWIEIETFDAAAALAETPGPPHILMIPVDSITALRSYEVQIPCTNGNLRSVPVWSVHRVAHGCKFEHCVSEAEFYEVKNYLLVGFPEGKS